MTVSDFIAVEPDMELEFRKPFQTVVKEPLTIYNTSSDSPIAFKVKTTAPKQYCVRPNSGKIPPNGSIQVSVLLQAMKEDPPADFKCKDKFLVQAIKISRSDFRLEGEDLAERLQDLWADAESTKKNDPDSAASILCEKKLRTVYVSADDSNSFDDSAESPRSGHVNGNGNGYNARSAPNNAATEKELSDAKDTIKRLAAACDGYKSEIERLNQLRQRRDVGGPAAGSRAMQMQQTKQKKGMSIQIVAILALISFILGAYFF